MTAYDLMKMAHDRVMTSVSSHDNGDSENTYYPAHHEQTTEQDWSSLLSIWQRKIGI